VKLGRPQVIQVALSLLTADSCLHDSNAAERASALTKQLARGRIRLKTMICGPGGLSDVFNRPVTHIRAYIEHNAHRRKISYPRYVGDQVDSDGQ
jgi:hypothetical protein